MWYSVETQRTPLSGVRGFFDNRILYKLTFPKMEKKKTRKMRLTKKNILLNLVYTYNVPVEVVVEIIRLIK